MNHKSLKSLNLVFVWALKRKFLSDLEKKVLRYNALAIWLVSWLESNRIIETYEFAEIQYVTLGLPEWIFWVALAIACVTTSAMVTLMGARAMRGDLPVNGLLAYLSASYAWLILIKINVLLVIVVPLFHSLQYLAVVWRYQVNKEESRNEGHVEMFSGLLKVRRSKALMMRFVWIGFCFGVFFFWAIPVGLDWVVKYPEEVFGASLFYFIFLLFINVHHYFLDNVMWRKENKDVAQNLFH